MEDRRPAIVIASAIVLIAGLVGGWALITSGQQESAAITEVTDTAVIQSSIELSHLSIATSENFARQRIYIISAYLKNVAARPLRMAEVKMTFTDFDGKPIREYSQRILNPKQKPLLAGDEFIFEVRQENLPRGWNYRAPISQITKLGY